MNKQCYPVLFIFFSFGLIFDFLMKPEMAFFSLKLENLVEFYRDEKTLLEFDIISRDSSFYAMGGSNLYNRRLRGRR